jgi:Co/Zn/Cd efflux system component
MSDCGCEFEARNREERRTLTLLLLINAFMFVFECVAAILAHSAGLLADSFDMFADAAVYGVSLYAIGRSQRLKARAAKMSGIVEIVLGVGVILEVARRMLLGSSPEGMFMVWVGALALAANLSCVALLAKHRKGEVHMRASWIFSTNDVLANIGVMLSGVLVAYTASSLPDLVIGAAISALIIWGGITILREAGKVLTEG